MKVTKTLNMNYGNTWNYMFEFSVSKDMKK
jgi:hypothetical protein